MITIDICTRGLVDIVVAIVVMMVAVLSMLQRIPFLGRGGCAIETSM